MVSPIGQSFSGNLVTAATVSKGSARPARHVDSHHDVSGAPAAQDQAGPFVHIAFHTTATFGVIRVALNQ